MEEISSLCLDMANLLKNYEPGWARVFRKFSVDVLERDWNTVKREIMSVYKGGMGSFNDLMLHNNVYILKRRLYDKVVEMW